MCGRSGTNLEIVDVESILTLVQDEEFQKFASFQGEDIGKFLPKFDNSFGVWYRGEGDARWKLKPKVFRDKDNRSDCSIYFEEANLIHHSQRRMPEYHGLGKTMFDWICHIQHYGLPTRLLDWTENILIALYYAVEDEEAAIDGAVYALNGRLLNSTSTQFESFKGSICIPDSVDVIARATLAISRTWLDWKRHMGALSSQGFIHRRDQRELWRSNVEESGDEYRFKDGGSLDKPVAVFPTRLNQRMSFQSSMFTIHGGKNYPTRSGIRDAIVAPDPTFGENPDGGRPEIVKKFIVKGCKKAEIKKQLGLLGIHEGTIYPEIDKQAGYIEKFWRATLDSPAGPPGEPG